MLPPPNPSSQPTPPANAMGAVLRPVRCTCGKGFKSTHARAQHQRDATIQRQTPSGAEAAAAAAASPSPSIAPPTYEESMRNLLPQSFAEMRLTPIPSASDVGAPSAPSERGFGERLAWRPVTFVEAGTQSENSRKKKKKEKRGKGRSGSKRGYGGGGEYGYMELNPLIMDMDQDQNWGLCDKDCGWCGHCAEAHGY